MRNKRTNGWKWLSRLAVLGLTFSLAGCLKAGGFGSADSFSPSDKFSQIYDILENEWYYAPQMEDFESEMTEKALSGMVSFDNDIHTMYLPLEQATTYSEMLEGSNVGIGVGCYKTEEGPMTVKSVFINSPADEAGLKAGDQILQIDDLETSGMELDDVISYIKENADHPYKLQVLRDGQPLTLELTATSYDSTVAFDAEEEGYGIITLSSFSSSSGKDTVEAMKRIEESGAKNLILDLRGNSGGYLHAMQTIASALLPKNTVIFQEKLRDGTVKETKTDDDSYQADFDHIYILQNKNSASASEVLIGALKDQIPDQVTTIGTTTYGKGTEQLNKRFDDGTSLKYTIAEWLTPNGTSVNNVGIKPDVEVELEEYQSVSYRDMEDDAQPIKPDTVDDNAAAVQVYLRFLGYPAQRSDSYFAPASSEALKLFQQDHGLEATGEVSAQTMNALTNAVAEKINTEGYESDRVFQKALELMNSEN